MSDKRPVDDAVLVDRFWHNYFPILEKSRIHKTAMPWYRKHVEAYIKTHTGRRLSSHLPAQIDDYLNAKGRHLPYPNGSFVRLPTLCGCCSVSACGRIGRWRMTVVSVAGLCPPIGA
jgi:hypothetical protein